MKRTYFNKLYHEALLYFRAPVAVGVTLVSSRDLLEDGMRGKGVLIYHLYQDLLWFVFHKMNSLIPDMKMHILLTVLPTFLWK